jgi:protein-arginine kinase
MKELLEAFLSRISNGKSLYELYSEFGSIRNSNKIIEGFSEKELMNKLDMYVQAIFADEREIESYRNCVLESRNVKTMGSTLCSPLKKERVFH